MAETGLPPGWEIRHSSTRNLPYYYHTADATSQWTPPPGSDTTKLRAHLALHHPTATGATASSTSGAPPPPGQVRAAHLLVKHRESRRPSSWRQGDITRSKAEAMEVIRGYEGRIRRGDISLGELATTESDDNSARKQGDLGYFGRGQMQREFEEVAFGLRVGQVSGIVDSASGLHLIQRLN